MADKILTYEFTFIASDLAKAKRDLESVGIYGVNPKAAAVSARGSEAQIRKLFDMGYDVDCWDLNDKLKREKP